ncbi:nucleolar complex protein [Anaeramoeba flamelloides]|uniref:Nucleolar complex protein n=1 Tax=Anaeramoeba flamelloides TaxID=1746091 RepID=A0ABQ8XK72_9EUKA|nr:nucleolar complex protein [Anaeramoeba flamelloides]
MTHEINNKKNRSKRKRKRNKKNNKQKNQKQKQLFYSSTDEESDKIEELEGRENQTENWERERRNFSNEQVNKPVFFHPKKEGEQEASNSEEGSEDVEQNEKYDLSFLNNQDLSNNNNNKNNNNNNNNNKKNLKEEVSSSDEEGNEKEETEIDEYVLYKKIQEKKENISRISLLIIENPEKSINLVKKLFEYCSDEYKTIQQLSLLSLTRIYIDILPGYRIRKKTSKEKSVRLSKDVYKLNKFEEKLITYYEKFIEFLLTKAGIKKSNNNNNNNNNNNKKKEKEKEKDDKEKRAFGKFYFLCIKSLCIIVESKPNFNFSEAICCSLVEKLSQKKSKTSPLIFSTLIKVLSNDTEGTLSVKIVRKICQVLKTKNFAVNPLMLRTLLHINIDPERLKLLESLKNKQSITLDPKRIRKRNDKMKRKLPRNMKIKKKHQEGIKKDLEEAEAVHNQKARAHKDLDILNAMFLTFFRILKRAPQSKLLSITLEALAKFSHLINLDFFEDILAVMNDIITEQKVDLVKSLFCIITSIKIIRRQETILNTDLKEFSDKVYSHLIDLSDIVIQKSYEKKHEKLLSSFNQNKQMNKSYLINNSKTESLLPLITECVELMFLNSKQLSITRVAGYIKKLSICTLHVDEGYAIALLTLIRKVIEKYPKTLQLLDFETTSSGIFSLQVKSPEYSNPFSTSLWELSSLRNHFSQPVIDCSQIIANNSRITERFMGEPQELANQFHLNEIGVGLPKIIRKRKKKTYVNYNHQKSLNNSPFINKIISELQLI